MNQKSVEEGATPLDMAKSRFKRHSPILHLLREYGAKQAIEKRRFSYNLFIEQLMDYYAKSGFEAVEFLMAKDGSHLAALNVYPKDQIYFIAKVEDPNDEAGQEEALDEIKDALFPNEPVVIRRITQPQADVLDLTLERLDV